MRAIVLLSVLELVDALVDNHAMIDNQGLAQNVVVSILNNLV